MRFVRKVATLAITPIVALSLAVLGAPVVSAVPMAATAAKAPTAKAFVWVSGKVKNGYGKQIAVVNTSDDGGIIRRGTINPSGDFKVAIPSADIETSMLLLLNKNGGSAGPIVLAHTASKAYLTLTARTGNLGTIVQKSHYAVVQSTLAKSEYSTVNSMKLKNGKIDGLPTFLKAVLAPKGGTTEECLNEPWAKGENTEGYELIDQQYKHVWGNRVISREHWEDITLPATWLFWIKNSPREVIGTGEFLSSPLCNEGLYSYKDMYDARWMNLTDFKSLNQPIDEAGTWTKSIMVKQHVLTYAVGKKVWYVTDPNGVKSLIITRDPQRTTDTPTLLPGWKISDTYTLSKELKYYLLGDDITNIRANNGDSFQSCPTCDFPNLAEYSN